MNKTLTKAREAYLAVLEKESPTYLQDIAEALYQNSVEWGKTMGLFAMPDATSKLSPENQIGLMLAGLQANYRSLVPVLAKAFSLALGKEVVYTSCAGTPTNNHLRTTQDKWVCVVPIVSIGASYERYFPVNSVALFRQSGNRSGANITNYNSQGLMTYQYSHYQSQSRLPSKTEIVEFLLELSMNCPEILASLQDDLGLVTDTK